ncbi:Protein-l-isoaspartate o-methyltransferase, partial [Globisporangium splendens]
MSFWPCSSNTHEGLVKNLRKTGIIQHDEVYDAMLKTDRANYMAQMETPDGGSIGELVSYSDSPHPIGYNQTISAPHMHAHALELAYAAVKDVNRPRILDVGAGSGYLTACFGRLVEKQHGRVFGVEIISGLAQFAKKNIQLADGDLVDNGVVSVHCCNGCDGLSSESPFHFIHVGAAADAAPQALLDQLADGGRLVIPLDQDRGGQMFVEIARHGNIFSQRKLMGVCYVPLVRGHTYRVKLVSWQFVARATAVVVLEELRMKKRTGIEAETRRSRRSSVDVVLHTMEEGFSMEAALPDCAIEGGSPRK